MVGFQKPENNLSQKDEAKTRRPLCYYRSTGTGNLPTQITENMANSRCLSRCTPTTLQGERNLRRKLYTTSTRTTGRRRNLRCRNHPQSSKTRTRIPILHQMAGISYHRRLVVTRARVLK